MNFQSRKKDLSDLDQRLKQKIAITSIEEKISRCFLLIKKRTNVLLYTNESVLNNDFISFALKDRTIIDFMDALCAFKKGYLWQENKKNYLFYRRQDEKELATAYIPETGPQKDWYNNIVAFKEEAKKLSPDLQKQMGTGQGVSVGALPKSMQGYISNVLEAHNQLMRDGGKGSERGAIVDANNLQNSFLALKNTGQTPEGINLFAFAFSNHDTYATFTHNDYAEQLEAKRKEQQQKGLPNIEKYSYEEGKADLKDLENQPILKTKIKLKLRNVDLAEVMRYLGKYYQVEYISDSEEYAFVRKDIDLLEMPLKEIMEQLCKIYHAGWECRKTGILVVWITSEPMDVNDPEFRKGMLETERRLLEAERRYQESHKEPPPAF